ncbi:MAG: AAC(3) family N-acetyltransferase [Patescibacteria group bacterium]
MIPLKKSKFIFSYNNQNYEKLDIFQALRNLGIKHGDSVFVHSDVARFGKIIPGTKRDEYLEAFLDALKDAVGRNGNVIMPSFTYSFCKKEIFYPLYSPSTVGILSEYFRKQSGVSRSLDAIFSVAAYGPLKSYFTKVGTNCFGENSIFEKLYLKNVKIVFVGNTFDITYMHFIEQRFGVPYRFMKKFEGKIEVDGELKRYTFDYNVRDLEVDVVYNLEKIARFLENRGVLSTVKLGYSKIRIISAVNAYDVLFEGLKNNVWLLCKKKKK